MVIKDALYKATEKLSSVSDTPSLDSKLLLEKACDCDRLFLIKNRNDELPSDALEEFSKYINRRIVGEPVAYITGTKEFMGLDFFVNSNVLIPRPDTETLCEYAIKSCHGKILDIGTGSGCISISIAKYAKDCEVTAADISLRAIETAKTNAEKNEVSIKFICLDILNDDILGRYDAIVSNPPYIRTDVIKGLSPSVKDFEPKLALDGGNDGLEFYRVITKKAYKALNTGGVLIYEIGFDQGDEVSEIVGSLFSEVTVIKDLAGNDRVVSGIKKH